MDQQQFSSRSSRFWPGAPGDFFSALRSSGHSNSKGHHSMKTKRVGRGRLTGAAGVAAVLLTAGCAVTAVETAAPAQEGVVLEYRMAEGGILRYQSTGTTREIADLMGVKREAETRTKSDISFRSKGRKDGHHLLEVTVNDLATDISSAQGSLSVDMSPVKGKSFDMVLSPLGAEVDVSGAEAITFEVGESTRNIASGFKLFFPDLAGRPVKVGDAWPSEYKIEDTSSTTTVTFTIEGVSTLEGFETIEGLECTRISSKFIGGMSGRGKLQGMDMTLSGTIKGTDVTYFAPREGIYVRSTTEIVREVTASLSGPQNLTIPSTQTTTMEARLVSR